MQAGDKDEDGVSIPANALALAGGTIKGPAGTTDADLAYEAVAAEDGHKVDGSLISPPAVKSISFVSSPTRGDTYERGEMIWVLVQFDRAVTVTGRARVPLTIGDGDAAGDLFGLGHGPCSHSVRRVRRAGGRPRRGRHQH